MATGAGTPPLRLSTRDTIGDDGAPPGRDDSTTDTPVSGELPGGNGDAYGE